MILKSMEIPQKYCIYDSRTSRDFENGTLSGYKKRDVILAFQNAMINSKYEEAVHWGVELHVSTYSKDMWKSIITIYFQYIHLNNPKLFFYIIQRKKEYDAIIIHYPKHHHIFCRNNQEIRNLFCDLIVICALSKKNNMFLPSSLPKVNITKITFEELQKRKIKNSYDIIQDLGSDEYDDIEILCLNQLFSNLSNHQGTLQNCFYWYLLLEKTKKQRKLLKKKNDVFWIRSLWSLIEKIKPYHENEKKMIKLLKEDYDAQFKETNISSLKYHIFIIFCILKGNQLKWNKRLIPQYDIYIQCCVAINFVYIEKMNHFIRQIGEENTHLVYQRFKETKQNMISKDSKETKPIQQIKNININKIIGGNPLTQDEVEIEDFHDNTKLINKNKTIKDVEEAKTEKVDKKLDYLSQFISKKTDRKKPVQETVDEVKEFTFEKKKR